MATTGTVGTEEKRKKVEIAFNKWEEKAKRGFLRLIVLKRFSEKDKYGNYSSLTGMDLINFVSDHSNGKWVPSPGSIYPILAEMQKLDMIEETASRNRKEKSYRITEIGLEVYRKLRSQSPIFHGEVPDLTEASQVKKFKDKVRSHFVEQNETDLKKNRRRFELLMEVIDEILSERANS